MHHKHIAPDSSIIAQCVHSLLLNCSTVSKTPPEGELTVDVEPLFTCARNTCFNLLAGNARIMKSFWMSVVQKVKTGTSTKNLLFFLDQGPFCGATGTLCFGPWLALPMCFRA